MAPVDNSPSSSFAENFKLLYSLKATNDIPVHKYKSQKSGITLVFSEIEGPEVCGYFCLVTEAHDDDGLPHTLEHLIFLGSEDYPFKGVLDLLANRCLASGTNAWTDVDHTAYTIKTAGSEGFLKLLPIYLDHILYPTLTEAGFITEVHHVTKEGQDAGVVYSEEEGSENDGECLVHRAFVQATYPGQCGYKSNTGGALKNLRESTTIEKVRDYHKEFYRPENLTLIINGQVKPEDVFKALEPLEDKISKKGSRGPFQKPWQEPCPPLTESVDKKIHFPSDKEDNGMVHVGWRGPSVVKDYEEFVALLVLLKYLTDTSVSPLRKNFVDIEDPLASEVRYTPIENSESVLYLQFVNVPLAKLDEVKPKLDSLLGTIVSDKDPIDMERMATVIHRKKLDHLSSLDSDPHNSLAFSAIGDMLYGNSKQDFEMRLNEDKILDKLLKEDVNFWKSLLKKYLVEAPSATIRGIPSKDEQKRLEGEDAARVAERVKALGDDGLAQKDKELLDAIDANERPPPSEMLTSVTVSGVDSIKYHPLKQFTSESSEQHPKFDTSQVPVYIQVDHVHSNFVYMFALMDSSDLTERERLYLPLLFELLLESPINRNGVIIPYEKIISEMESDTANVNTNIGFGSSSNFECGAYSHTVFLCVQVELEKYEKGIIWLRELLYQTVITEERIKIIATKLVNELSEFKRSGTVIGKELMRSILYHEGSNHYAVSLIRQEKFLTEILSSLSSPDGSSKVVAEIKNVLKTVTNPEKIVIHLSCNLDKLSSKIDNPATLWNQLLPLEVKTSKDKLKAVPDHELMRADKMDDLSCVTGVGSVKSSFYYQTAPGIKDFLDKDLAPLLVCIQYLTQLEGPMWRKIRGQGLAYGYSIVPRPNEGLLYFSLYMATDVIGSFKEALIILKETLADGNELDNVLFESAKSSLLYEIIEREKTIAGIINQSLLSYFRNVDYEYDRNLVKQISTVTINDAKEIGKKYLQSLIDLDKSKISMVTDPAKLKTVADAFSGFGKKLNVYDTIEDSFLNK